MEDTETETAIFCNLVKFAEVGLGHQPNHKTLSLQYFLPARYAVEMQDQNLLEWPTNEWSDLKPKPLEEAHARHCLDYQ